MPKTSDKDRARMMKLLQLAFDPSNSEESRVASDKLREMLHESGMKIDDLLPPARVIPFPIETPAYMPEVETKLRAALGQIFDAVTDESVRYVRRAMGGRR